MRRQNDAAILILGEDHRALKNQTLACRTPVALGKYDLPLPYVIALETRGSAWRLPSQISINPLDIRHPTGRGRSYPCIPRPPPTRNA